MHVSPGNIRAQEQMTLNQDLISCSYYTTFLALSLALLPSGIEAELLWGTAEVAEAKNIGGTTQWLLKLLLAKKLLCHFHSCFINMVVTAVGSIISLKGQGLVGRGSKYLTVVCLPQFWKVTS